ncbi:hypothetical protein YSA_01594 [Pseudomonas putida ND6]|uniref:Uncharacterized protein n=1 Tax=Pseudomonas putida ND6 TaxID=231023 RepID=I3UQ69_PSEPU|nr:hypothetical protein YSA_01594 [Pseudomonas putida ND6]
MSEGAIIASVGLAGQQIVERLAHRLHLFSPQPYQ